MICDECGKSNISGLSECSYCGAKMPKTSNCGGFVDILSYKTLGGTTPTVKPNISRCENGKKSEGVSNLDVQKLIKKFDSLMKSTKVNSLFGLIAIGLSFLIFVSSIVFGIVTISNVKGYKEETMTQLEETRKDITDYKAQIGTLLEKIEDKNDDTNKAKGKNDNKDDKKDELNQKTTNNETNDKAKALDKTDEKEDKIKNPSSSTKGADGNIKSINKKTEE